MSVTLTAIQCPAIVRPPSILTISDATVSPGNSLVNESIIEGDTEFSPKQRRNATRQDIGGRYGGGGYAVLTGLGLSIPTSGLLLNVAAGQSMLDGPVGIVASTVAVADNTGRVWVWFTQAGALSVVNTSLAPPASICTLLGSVSTQNGGIQQVDTSGVIYLRGGSLWRQTADVA